MHISSLIFINDHLLSYDKPLKQHINNIYGPLKQHIWATGWISSAMLNTENMYIHLQAAIIVKEPFRITCAAVYKTCSS